MEYEARGRTTRRWVLALPLAGAAAGMWPLRARAAHIVKNWPIGQAAPPLALSDLDGKAWDLAALGGQVVALNFWATWCEPCRQEMTSLEALQSRARAQGLAILAVNYKEPVTAIRHFLETVPLRLPILLDADGEATAAWTPRVFPSTVLIDRRGVPRTLVVGAVDWAGREARRLVDPLLARRA